MNIYKIGLFSFVFVIFNINSWTIGVTVGPIEVHRIPWYPDVTTQSPKEYFTPMDLNHRSDRKIPNSRHSINNIMKVVTDSMNFRRTRPTQDPHKPFQVDQLQRNYQMQQEAMRKFQRPKLHYDKTKSYVTPPTVYYNYASHYPSQLQLFEPIDDKYKKSKSFSALRDDLSGLKSRHHNKFVSEDDERPARQKSQPQNEQSPGHEIFEAGKFLFEKNKDKFREIVNDAEKSKKFAYKEYPKILSHANNNNNDHESYHSNPERDNNKYQIVHDHDDNNDGFNDEDETPFIPVQRYAQVRKISSIGVAPKPHGEPRARERIKMEKSHTIYTEDGYADEEYEHGGDEKFGAINEKIKNRRKRNTDNGELKKIKTAVDDEHFEEIEELPISLPLSAQRSNLTGNELIKYISELLKNTSIYLPDENSSEMESFVLSRNQIKEMLKKKEFKPSPTDVTFSASTVVTEAVPILTSKFPYYNLPTHVLNEMSALRYAENVKRLPNRNFLNYYATKDDTICDESDPRVEPTKEEVDNSSYQNHRNQGQKLGQLGDRIGCMKRKYFGEHPLDNPIFKEQFVTANVDFNDPFNLQFKTTIQPHSAASTAARPIKHHQPHATQQSDHPHHQSEQHPHHQSEHLQKRHHQKRKPHPIVHPLRPPQQRNQLKHVYDDVLSNIRSAQIRDQEQHHSHIVPAPTTHVAIEEDPAFRDDDNENDYEVFENSQSITTPPQQQEDMYVMVMDKKYQFTNQQSQHIPPSTFALFDVNQFIPTIYMIKPNGKVYRVKYTTRKRSVPAKPSQFQNLTPSPPSDVAPIKAPPRYKLKSKLPLYVLQSASNDRRLEAAVINKSPVLLTSPSLSSSGWIPIQRVKKRKHRFEGI